MAKLPENPTAIRDKDEKTATGEVLPDKQTLSVTRLNSFIEDKVTLATFDKDFNLAMAIDYTKDETTENGKLLHQLLEKTKDKVDAYKVEYLFAEQTKSTVERQLNTLQSAPTNMPRAAAMEIMQCWNYFDYLRSTAKRLLYLKEAQQTERKEFREGEVNPLDDAKATFGGILNDAKKNWNKWSSMEKVAVTGIAVVGAAFLLTSENSMLQSIRKGLVTAAGIGGAGYLAWKSYELLTGKSPMQSLTDTTRASTRSGEFFAKIFECNEQQHEALTKSIVFLGDKDFLALARQYQQAKASKSIEGLGMDGKQAYVGLDMFFSKYPINQMRDKFRNENPPLTFAQVINIAMAEDPSVKIYDNAGTSLSRYVYETANETFNYAASSTIGTYIREGYVKYIEGEPNPEEKDKMARNFRGACGFEAEVPKVIDDVIAKDDYAVAQAFRDTWDHGRPESQFNLRHHAPGDGYVYVISEVDVSKALQKDELIKKELESSEQNSVRFLSRKFSVSNTVISKESQKYGHVFVAQNGKAFHFSRYKA